MPPLTWNRSRRYKVVVGRRSLGGRWPGLARWQSGDAADCKSAYGGSIPPRASNDPAVVAPTTIFGVTSGFSAASETPPGSSIGPCHKTVILL